MHMLYAAASFSLNSSDVIGDENQPKVPVVACFCPSSVIVATQSVSVITCNRRHERLYRGYL